MLGPSMETETASKEQRNCTGKHKHRGKVETDGLTDGEILLFTSYKYQLTNKRILHKYTKVQSCICEGKWEEWERETNTPKDG